MDDCDQTSNMQKGSVKKMSKALVIIDIQNDITKNYRDIIDKINKSVEWAQVEFFECLDGSPMPLEQ